MPKVAAVVLILFPVRPVGSASRAFQREIRAVERFVLPPKKGRRRCTSKPEIRAENRRSRERGTLRAGSIQRAIRPMQCAM